MYRRIIRPLLFTLPPEQAHYLTLKAIRALGALPPARALVTRYFKPQDKPVQAFGLTFKNPVGLAAGYDKDADSWRGLACLGFGHIEVGTITPVPQAGNPKPRVFRLVEDQAVINRMGFPGKGAAYALQQLQNDRPADVVIGVNIGKNKDTPLETAFTDYLSLIETFAPLADYLAINISSPNTAGLRKLQSRGYLETLLYEITAKREQVSGMIGRSVPLLVKLAPDLEFDEIDEALDAITAAGIDGIIAANTTTHRPTLRSKYQNEEGGLSGAPLAERSNDVIRHIRKSAGDSIPIIGVGGIMNADDAQRKLDAGANLVQIYTGLVYRGPGLIRQIVNELATSPAK